MSLAFLSPDAAPSRELRARSPMERLAVAAGARLADVAGWNVASAYAQPQTEHARLTQTVGFVDRSSLAKIEVQAEPETLARIVAVASGGVASGRGSGGDPASGEGSPGGVALAPGLARRLALAPGLARRSALDRTTETWWCPLTPARALVLSEPAAAVATRAALDAAAREAPGTVSVVDLTSGLAALSLVGPQARELLARFCAIDVRPALAPPGAFRPGSVARTPGCVLVEGPERLLVLVGWALGEYLWRVVADAAATLGGGPVGAEALARLLERDDA